MRIPNKLTGPLMLIGLVGHGVLGGADGFTTALFGWAIAFALHYTLASLGLEGAGDGKLMMAVGAFTGWETMVEATIWRYLFLLPYAAVVLTFFQRWGHFQQAVLWTMGKAMGKDVGPRPEPLKMPFGPVIALVVPLSIHTNWLGLG